MKSKRRKYEVALTFAVLCATLAFIIISIGCVSAESSFTQQNNNKSAFSASWTTETVDADKYFTDFYPRAIAIDGFNRPHIAYGGDHLYHAYFDGIEWRYETVDNSPEVGRYASIAIDSNNKVHISYYDLTNDDLKYATNVSGAWMISTIDSEGSVGRYTSIAIDSNNKVHISYFDLTNDDLKYATNVSGAWVTSTIDSGGSVGWYTSIAIDSNNKMHISYYRGYPNNDLKYATNASGTWVRSTIDGVGGVGWYTSIAVDSNDNVHISYYDATNDDLKYATDASGAWVMSTIDSARRCGKVYLHSHRFKQQCAYQLP